MLVPISDEELLQIQERAAVNLLVPIIYQLYSDELLSEPRWPRAITQSFDQNLVSPLRGICARLRADEKASRSSWATFDIRQIRRLYDLVSGGVHQISRDTHHGIFKITAVAKRCTATPHAAFILEVQAVVFAHGPYGDADLRALLHERGHRHTVQFGERLAAACHSAREFDRLISALVHTADAKHCPLHHIGAMESAFIAFLENVDQVIDV